MVPRRFVQLAVVTLLLVACKRPQTPAAGPVWDEEPGPAKVEALGTLSPPWNTPIRIVFDNGLVTFWLHEPDTPSFHLRVLLPVDPSAGPDDVAAIHVATDAIRWRLDRMLRNVDARVEVTPGPGRLELAVHGRQRDHARILTSLATAMATPPERNHLAAAVRRIAKDLPARPKTEDLAVAVLAARLLGRDPGALHLNRQRVASLGANRVNRAWKTITNPSRAVLIAHAGSQAEASRPHLDDVAQRWPAPRSLGAVDRPPALARLRPSKVPPTAPGRLLAEPKTELERTPTEGRGDPVVALGRLIATPDPSSRSRARLAQRVLQEEMDARLTILGNFALFVVVVDLDDEGSADKTLERAVRSMSEWSRERQPVQRLFQAAQLWLGARIVQASLHGEDWTALWADALDLASDEDGIALALAQNASIMLESDSAALTQWQSQWLDPVKGTPGWHWVLAGANSSQIRDLQNITPVASAR